MNRFNFLLAVLISLVFGFDDSLSLEYVGQDTINVNISTNTEIKGFQFNIESISIIEAFGGAADSLDFDVSVNNNTVLGFTFTGVLPVGEYLLLSLRFTTPVSSSSICMDSGCWPTAQDECAMSDSAYQPIQGFIDYFQSDVSKCIEVPSGCIELDACNYSSEAIHSSDDCSYGTTYYQDADGDGNGNPSISQSSCDAIDGYVTNSDDDNDECSGTVDDCGVCDGGNSSKDCAGVCSGTAYLDDCGVCSGGESNHVANSDWDACGVCDGDGSSCAGCDGVANSGVIEDECGNCGGDCVLDSLTNLIICSPSTCAEDSAEGCENKNLIIADCEGVCGGDNVSCLSISDEILPSNFEIRSAYPNPFNPSVNIEYSVGSLKDVAISIIGIDGRHIETISNSLHNQGIYNVEWAPENISSGMYLIQLKADNQIQIKKIIYLK